MQINHAGSVADKEVIGEMPVVPSPIANPQKGNIPYKLTNKTSEANLPLAKGPGRPRFLSKFTIR